MKIAIDLTPLYGRKHTGVELYAIDLYKALLKTGNDIVPIFHEKNEIDNNHESYIIHGKNRLLLENFLISKAFRKISPDIALFPIFPPPIDLYLKRTCNIVPVIHDTAFIRFNETLKFAAKYYLTPKYKFALKHANYIVTISETAKKQLQEYAKVPVVNWGENISSDFLPENLIIDKGLLKEFNLRPYDYYISVSTIEPRKNLKYLLKSIRQELVNTGKKLVLVGRKGWGKDEEQNRLIDEMKDYVIFTEYISTAALQTLYHYAYAFALLSLDEGFGRTPLEAIACGCKKIIVSDIEIFHETLGVSGNYIPLNNIKEATSLFINDTWRNVNHDFPIPFNELEKKIHFL